MRNDARCSCCLLAAFVQLAQGPHDLQSLRVLHAGEEATVDYLEYQEPDSYTYRACKNGFRSSFWA